jgi:hypothetical protein
LKELFGSFSGRHQSFLKKHVLEVVTLLATIHAEHLVNRWHSKGHNGKISNEESNGYFGERAPQC